MSALFGKIFDDAALFPPRDAAVGEAVSGHRDLLRRFGELVGPFVVGASRLPELAAVLAAGEGATVEISLIAPAAALVDGIAAVEADARMALVAVEVPGVVDGESARTAVKAVREAVPDGVHVAVELPRSRMREEVLDELAAAGLRAKLRTGGLEAGMFPGEQELAETILACVSRGVPFKCTAGLHHAVRHTASSTGFEHHGFLNVLAAADAAGTGASAPEIAALLAQRNGEHLAADLRGWDTERARAARDRFTSLGTCSITEPVDDLVTLGLLALPHSPDARDA